MPDPATAARLIVAGVLFGLAAAMPVGPVNVEMARRTLRGGFSAGAAVGFGAVTVDVILAAASVLLLTAGAGGAMLTTRPAVYWALKLAGAGLLVYLGASCLLAAWRARKPAVDATKAAPAASNPPTVARGYLTGLLLNGLNPIVWSVWFVVLPALAAKRSGPGGADLTAGSTGANLPMLCAGVFLGTSGWVLAFAGGLSRVRRPGAAEDGLPGRWLVAVDALGGATLLGFAAATLAGLV